MTVTFSEYDRCLDVFDAMAFRANGFAPSREMIERHVIPEQDDDDKKFVLFLAWVEETGFDTPENADDRKYIRQFVKENLKIV